MSAPRPLTRHPVNDDRGRAKIKKERERKETGVDLNAGPLLVHRFVSALISIPRTLQDNASSLIFLDRE